MAALVSYLLFSIALLVLLISISSKIITRPKKHYSPPSPPTLPILGNLHQLGSLPHRSLQALSIKHGPLMLLQLGKIPTIVVSSAELAQEILKTKDQLFANRPFSYAAQHLLYGGNDMAYAPYGSYWRQVRKICILELLSSRRVQSFKPIREEEVGRMIKEISSISSMEKAAVNLSHMFMSLSENIISRVALGKTCRFGEEENRIGYLSKELEELLAGFYVVDYFPSLEWIDVLSGKKRKLTRNFKGWDDFLDRALEEKSRMMSYDDDDQDQLHNNFLSVLLQVQRDGGSDGTQLSRESIKAIVLVSPSLPLFLSLMHLSPFLFLSLHYVDLPLSAFFRCNSPQDI